MHDHMMSHAPYLQPPHGLQHLGPVEARDGVAGVEGRGSLQRAQGGGQGALPELGLGQRSRVKGRGEKKALQQKNMFLLVSKTDCAQLLQLIKLEHS